MAVEWVTFETNVLILTSSLIPLVDVVALGVVVAVAI